MVRVEQILKHDDFIESLILNDDREKDRRFCRHNLQHLLNVSRVCYILLLEELAAGRELPGIDPACLKEVVYAAGLLHDMARWREYDTGEDHALTGAALAAGVLRECGFSEEEAAVITGAISRHRSNSTGGDLLAECLRRADDLARPCWNCRARQECKKLARMESAERLIY